MEELAESCLVLLGDVVSLTGGDGRMRVIESAGGIVEFGKLVYGSLLMRISGRAIFVA